MKNFSIYLRLNWVKLLVIFLVLSFVGFVAILLISGFNNFAAMEAFSRKQLMAQMGMYLIMGIVQGVIYVALFGVMHYYLFMGGGMAKMLGSDSSEQVNPDIKWNDVIGMEGAKRDAWEIVEFLRDQTRLKLIGGKIIKGTMFLGPPGCGKTYLAKAIATEAGLPFLSAVGSDFVGMLVGQGAAKMRSLFKKARKFAKIYGGCIIFIDEIDSFAMPRRADMGWGGQSSMNATINQFLTELDGLRKQENNVVVFAATNFNEAELDPAITRSGRFDRKIRVDYPGTNDRKALIEFYLHKVKYDPRCQPDLLAKETMWFSAADIDAMVREAAIYAQREKRDTVSDNELKKAKQHIIDMLTKNGGRNIAFAQQHVYWDDVIGMELVKKEVWEIILRLRNYRQSYEMTNKLAKAYLFLGPPGTGKTHFIKALSTETQFPIIPLSSSEILAMHPFEGRNAIKRTFEEARSLNRTEKGCILYISNIDVLVWDDRSVSFYDTVQNFFLSELDTILDESNNIFIIAETSLHEDSLSKQLIKPNRFSQKIDFYRPGAKDRHLFLQHFLKNIPYAPSVDLDLIVKKTQWFSVVDLRSMIKETVLLAQRDNVPLSKEHFLKSIEKTVEIIEKAAGSFLMATRVNVPWENVIGMETAKKDAWEVVELIKDQKLLKLIGGKIIKGTLMVGPPGCGKTYLAKAIATEAELPFLAVAGSEFVGVYIGIGAQRIKNLFKEARSLARAEGGCIIFIDEIDAFARPRGWSGTGGDIDHNATVNQFLTELDGLRKDENNIIVLAATNVDENDLDPAIVRSGRFERTIYIGRPNLKEREELLQFYLKKVQIEDSLNIGMVARKTLWFSPADIDHLVREAGLVALRNKREVITFKDISEAYDKVVYGNKSNLVLTPDQLEWTAYHEAGHAIILYILHPFDDVVKATIIPRAGSLGFAAPRAREERHSHNKDWYLAQIKAWVASYAAETIKFGTTSNGVGGGPGSDFHTALRWAHDMVWRYGMGKSGIIGDFHALTTWWDQHNYISEKTREHLDEDVQEIMQNCLKDCFNILNQHRDLFEYFAQELLRKQELEYDDIEEIFKKFNVKPLYRPPLSA